MSSHQKCPHISPCAADYLALQAELIEGPVFFRNPIVDVSATYAELFFLLNTELEQGDDLVHF